jgi:hypothetical protein
VTPEMITSRDLGVSRPRSLVAQTKAEKKKLEDFAIDRSVRRDRKKVRANKETRLA